MSDMGEDVRDAMQGRAGLDALRGLNDPTSWSRYDTSCR
jgi:hypothetical protein